MDQKQLHNDFTYKSAGIDLQEVTDEELKAINKFTLSPLKAEDVFSFKLAMCDNEVDRDYEYFSLKALEQLKKLFTGKTVIKDHNHKADNQVARIYATELVQSSKTTKNGELYTQLIAKAYMVKTPDNESLIAEIKAGIKKEVSVGCAINSAICSICGVDNAKSYCSHYHGKEYEVNGKKVQCTFKLDNALDAYEVSLVAVPAQRNAGACKSYGSETVYEKDQKIETPEKQPENNTTKDLELEANLDAIESFIFVENQN